MDKQLLDYIDEGIIILNEAYHIQFCNQSLKKRLNYSDNALENEVVGQIVVDAIEDLIDQSKSAKILNICLKDAYNTYIHSKGRIFMDEWEGTSHYWLVIKQFDNEIVSKEDLELIVENVPYVIWIADEKEHYRYVNENTRIMLNGYCLEEKVNHKNDLLQQYPSKFYRNKLEDSVFKKDCELLKKGIIIDEERSVMHQDSPYAYQIVKIPLFDKKHIYKGYIGIMEYNLLRHKVDVSKVIDIKNLKGTETPQSLYSQLVTSLELSAMAEKVLEEKIISILKNNGQTDQVEEFARLSKNKFVAKYDLQISKTLVVSLMRESKTWPLDEFSQRVGIQLNLEKTATYYIRIDPIEYNDEFMGVILTMYPYHLKYPLMEAYVINKVCQHMAMIFKNVEDMMTLNKAWERSKALEAESSAYKEALNIETLKTEFLANISHELKTPLNIIYSIIQAVELEIKETEDLYNLEKMINYKEIVKQNIYRLLRLINNITDISKTSTGYYDIKMVNCDVIQVIEEITMSTVAYGKDKAVTIIFDTEVEELEVACDIEKLERIMLNLLSNAVKYTQPGGHIAVNVHIENQQLVIEVADTGIGIPKAQQEVIFERFVQVESGSGKKIEGSGIGLALVRSLVEKQNGKITVVSEEGKGATFKVILPIILGEGEVRHTITSEREALLNYKCKVEFSNI